MICVSLDLTSIPWKVRLAMQNSMDNWEGLLHATGSALIPTKCFWYLINFPFVNNMWMSPNIKNPESYKLRMSTNTGLQFLNWNCTKPNAQYLGSSTNTLDLSWKHTTTHLPTTVPHPGSHWWPPTHVQIRADNYCLAWSINYNDWQCHMWTTIPRHWPMPQTANWRDLNSMDSWNKLTHQSGWLC